jgi:hypothetical protein
MAREERDKPDRSRRQARRLRRRLSTGTAIVGVTVVAIVVGWFAYRAVANLPGEKFADQGNLHITRETDPHVPYNSDPPTSGPHLPYIAPWGVHTRPITRELQVHNLEDGGVVVQYSCECPELAERLAKIVRRYDKQVILAPYPDMKAKIALTAWTRLLTLDDFDEAKIVRFIGAYRGVDHHK